MITLFSIPKPFVGHVGAIQRNALRSWTLLGPDCRVVLIGDEPGTAQAAQEFGITHVPGVNRNNHGTPLLNDVFSRGQQASEDPLLCYINADILLMEDFVQAVRHVQQQKRKFLIVGRRRDLEMAEEETLSFSHRWQACLAERVHNQGKLQGPTHIDYFVYRRNLWGRVPPFAVGRFAWDNWLIWRAHQLKVSIVDATEAITAVHQNHDYAHAAGGYKGARHGPEARNNFGLAGGHETFFTIWDSTHILSPSGLTPRKRAGLGGGIWSYRRSVSLGSSFQEPGAA